MYLKSSALYYTLHCKMQLFLTLREGQKLLNSINPFCAFSCQHRAPGITLKQSNGSAACNRRSYPRGNSCIAVGCSLSRTSCSSVFPSLYLPTIAAYRAAPRLRAVDSDSSYRMSSRVISGLSPRQDSPCCCGKSASVLPAWR